MIDSKIDRCSLDNLYYLSDRMTWIIKAFEFNDVRMESIKWPN